MRKIINIINVTILFFIGLLIGFILTTYIKKYYSKTNYIDITKIEDYESLISKSKEIIKQDRKEIKEKELQQIVEQKEEPKIEVKTSEPTKMNFTLTFYTNLPSENGGYTITAWGEELKYGMVASNVYKKGTIIYLEGYGDFIVADKGGSNFNKNNRLDVFIPRKQGESDSDYYKRVNNLGVVKTKGYIKR